MWRDLGAALALVLVLEGIWPFLNPGAVRRALTMIAQTSDSTLRLTGAASMLLGVVVLYLINR